MTRFQKTALVVVLLFATAILLFSGWLLFQAGQTPTKPSNSPPLPKGLPEGPLSPTPTPFADPTLRGLDEALQAAVRAHPETLAFSIYRVSVDQAKFSKDGNVVLLWLSLHDLGSGELVPAEPGLAIARRDDTFSPWLVTLQPDDHWVEALKLVPDDLIDTAQRKLYSGSPQPEAHGVAPLTGYQLPWQKGLTKILTGSIGHVFTYKSCPSSCLYSFDFADGTMFPISAAKGGRVKYAVWRYPNNNRENANFLVLEDTSTNPTTYQLYLHLAQDSIPPALRNPGTWVAQGQFIANVDSTGYSTGHHLHFQVHANPTAYWGNSLDIIFQDVAVNGGRPRTCLEAANFPNYGGQCQKGDKYTAGGIPDTQPPTGALTAPAAQTEITNQNVLVSGLGHDNIQVARMQVVGNYDGVWRDLGDPQTASPFSTQVDLCKAGVPNGPLQIGLQVWDGAGNQSLEVQGEVSVIMNFNCPLTPPLCRPGDNQVALHVNPDYQGICQLLPVGEYQDLGQLEKIGTGNLESLQVGKNVRATLYLLPNFEGRSETFNTSDPNLADNRVGTNSASSLIIENNSTAPAAPVLSPPGIGVNNLPTSADSLVLAWGGAKGAVDFRSELKAGDGSSRSFDWSTDTTWSVGSLLPGGYVWTVFARNSQGQSQASLDFSVENADSPAVQSVTAPYETTFDTTSKDWVGTGLWNWQNFTFKERTSPAWVTGNGSGYGNNPFHAGDLTSLPILIPTAGYKLRFSYLAGTESTAPFWDQRRVQISSDGRPFEDLLQLKNEIATGKWYESPEIDLSVYAGMTIRVRFHFDTVDNINNDLPGWAVDNLSIKINTGKSCLENTPGNTPDEAASIELGGEANAQICPAGDIDYYVFKKLAERKLYLELKPTNPPSILLSSANTWEPALFLLDGDGKSVVAEATPVAAGQPLSLVYTPESDGPYFIKVMSRDHPGSGGPDHSYTLRLIEDKDPPTLTVISPTTNSIPPVLPVNLSAETDDRQGSGVTRVEFWWHPADFKSKSWQLLFRDTDPSDGWSFTIPDTFQGELKGSAVYIQAWDRAGNSQGIARWFLQPDGKAPVSQLEPLPAVNASTAVLLKWSVDDQPEGLRKFEVQYRENGAEWKDLPQSLSGKIRRTWFVGKPAAKYEFRIRAVDTNGNVEAFPDKPQVSMQIEKACLQDEFETKPGDGSPENAAYLEVNKTQDHTVCGPKDEDWIKFNAKNGQSFNIKAENLSGGAAMVLQVFDGKGRRTLADIKPVDLSSSTIFKWTAPADGPFLIRAVPVDIRVSGSDARYRLKVEPFARLSPIIFICGAAFLPALFFLLKFITRARHAFSGDGQN